MVFDRVVQWFISQAVQILNHQVLEHHDHVSGRSTFLAVACFLLDLIHHQTKTSKINGVFQSDEGIAESVRALTLKFKQGTNIIADHGYFLQIIAT
jgi:hypothetical protein